MPAARQQTKREHRHAGTNGEQKGGVGRISRACACTETALAPKREKKRELGSFASDTYCIEYRIGVLTCEWATEMSISDISDRPDMSILVC
jgi:hypothetical protein